MMSETLPILVWSMSAWADGKETEMFETKIYKVLMDGPDDVSRLEKLIDDGEVAPGDIKGSS